MFTINAVTKYLKDKVVGKYHGKITLTLNDGQFVHLDDKISRIELTEFEN